MVDRTALVVDGLEFRWPGGMALRAELQLRAGARLALIGASGSGKSTLLNLLAGFEQPAAGSVRMMADGALRDVTHLPPSKRPLSILFQDNNLFPHLTVFDNVALGLSPKLALEPDQREQITQALTRVGLGALAARRPDALSGGERQRAALARALVRDHPLLLMDEPLGSLGPGLRADMVDLIVEVQRERNLTIIMVTHDPGDARRFATEVALMVHGQLATPMPPDSLDNPVPGSALADYLGR